MRGITKMKRKGEGEIFTLACVVAFIIVVMVFMGAGLNQARTRLGRVEERLYNQTWTGEDVAALLLCLESDDCDVIQGEDSGECCSIGFVKGYMLCYKTGGCCDTK